MKWWSCQFAVQGEPPFAEETVWVRWSMSGLDESRPHGSIGRVRAVERGTMDYPRMLFCDKAGRIYDEPGLIATARLGVHQVIPDPDEWISLPEGSDFFLLPNRRPIGWDEKTARFRSGPNRAWAASAFAPPGYVRSHLPNARPLRSARPLPLWAYSAAAWREDGFCVTAFPIQHDPKGDLAEFDTEEIHERIERKLDAFPQNRLLRHLANCARTNNCLAAKNYFLERWEGGVPISRDCPSACEGCISHQPDESPVPPSHARISFRPTMDEALEVIVPHLERAPLGMISFGQGCEGEPLCEAAFLEQLLKEVRRRTPRGTLHMNTNGYAPEAVRRLARAGLDSVRISINSAQEKYYHAYHKPKGYRFADVVKSAQIAVEEGLFVSINYLVFPGLTDHPEEIDAFTWFLKHTQAHMVQWKNLNIDPDQYISCLDLDRLTPSLGMRRTVDTMGHRSPNVPFGYFNPPREHFATSTTLFPQSCGEG